MDIKSSFDKCIINFYIYTNTFVFEKLNIIAIYIKMLGNFLMTLYNLHIYDDNFKHNEKYQVISNYRCTIFHLNFL